MILLLAMIMVLVAPAMAGTYGTAENADARAVLPDPRLNKEQYARYYLRAVIRTDDDLPFTTSGSFTLSVARPVWLGVYVRTPSLWTNAPAGMRVVGMREQFPEFVHGGCSVVNIVSDAETGVTLGSWCNIDDGAPTDGAPTPLPTYFPPQSPLR
jgi:hypothetical protein